MDGQTSVLIIAATGISLGVILVTLFLALAPANVEATIDTQARTGHVRVHSAWGNGPTWSRTHAASDGPGDWMRLLTSVPRLSRALLTRDLFNEVFALLRALYGVPHRRGRLQLALNLGDPAKNFVVSNAVRAGLALAPAGVREAFSYTERAQTGADFTASFVGRVSPLLLWLTWRRFRGSTPVRSFVRRMSTE